MFCIFFIAPPHPSPFYPFFFFLSFLLVYYNIIIYLSYSLCVRVGRENHELDIVLFHEVLDHIARFDRVLTSPGGSLLLSGRSGVGRRTALLLTAHMHQIEIVTPHISRNYGLKQFKNDLKAVSTLLQMQLLR